MSPLKPLFALDPEIVFLNHGSFGACPRPVMEAYQHWQWQLERQPVAFLGRQALSLLGEARQPLGAYLSGAPDNLVFFPNPTTAMNMVARSLKLHPGDEILTSDHEYGAMDRTWEFVCEKAGAHYRRVPVGLPACSAEEFVDRFLAALTNRTRAVFLSHITSATALRLPVETILARLAGSGIVTIVDGAHAPGQIPLHLDTLGAALYVGACHKWLCGPKGSAFVYASLAAQEWLEPLVVSWGYRPDPGYGVGNRFLDEQEWQGTRDLAAYLAVPAALDFLASHQWDAVRSACAGLAAQTEAQLLALTGLPPVASDPAMHAPQFFAAFLPEAVDPAGLKTALYETYRIEVPVYTWQGRPIMRVSIQGYNTPEDTTALLRALEALLPG